MKINESLNVDITRICTQAYYARKMGVSRSHINQEIKRGNIEVIRIKGSTLVKL